MSADVHREIRVLAGRVQPSGSWIYVWMDLETNEIVYIGVTGFDPELRTHLHLTSEQPEVGRVRATVPDYDARDFDILAFRVPPGVDRSEVKAVVTAALTGGSRAEIPASSETGALTEEILRVIRKRQSGS
ncbi:hypothetical protein [Microbacterium invictum]|uniref:GIY-YIG domain-containing protein n=1 Tax=Microbacterium invictum TaxID=515415 RepID=A0ABZ0V6C9_9MICO|nr:hypothetical protein [Microbacterium invictum]WQB69158.1 hypothetical protein T9R20_10600 [Microbacterium invictum]